jgi:hypothetical protein
MTSSNVIIIAGVVYVVYLAWSVYHLYLFSKYAKLFQQINHFSLIAAVTNILLTTVIVACDVLISVKGYFPGAIMVWAGQLYPPLFGWPFICEAIFMVVKIERVTDDPKPSWLLWLMKVTSNWTLMLSLYTLTFLHMILASVQTALMTNQNRLHAKTCHIMGINGGNVYVFICLCSLYCAILLGLAYRMHLDSYSGILFKKTELFKVFGGWFFLGMFYFMPLVFIEAFVNDETFGKGSVSLLCIQYLL